MTQPATRADDIITVDIAAGGWRSALGDAAARAAAAEAAAAALAAAGPEHAVEVGVRLAADADIRSLNRQYRGRDSATNVLSFGLAGDVAAAGADLTQPPDTPALLGDVVAAFETCAGEAEEEGKPLADHLRHMVVHGVLHLLGYDHETAEEAEQMEALERDILARLGVPDPYARAAA